MAPPAPPRQFLGLTAAQWQNGTRVALGVGALSTAGLLVTEHIRRMGWGWEYGPLLSNGLQWGAITVILVSSPLVGAVARTGLERTIGTVAGGLVGAAAAYAQSAAVMCALSFVATLGGFVAGQRLKLEYSGKLFPLSE